MQCYVKVGCRQLEKKSISIARLKRDIYIPNLANDDKLEKKSISIARLKRKNLLSFKLGFPSSKEKYLDCEIETTEAYPSVMR